MLQLFHKTKMKKIQFLILFFSLTMQAQFQVNGIVKSAVTNQSIPFVSIRSTDGTKTFSDVDGKFSILSQDSINEIIFSYVGFSDFRQKTEKNKNNYSVCLSPKAENEKAGLLENQNQALAIIQKVIRNKDSNNPQKKWNSFEFKSYNKLLVTANPDSIIGRIDSVFVKNKFAKIDSSSYKFKQILCQQHLFLTEKVSLFQFDKNKFKETILATKMAGFKQPIYEIIGLGLQSFSVYDSKYELFETNYKSPIATNAQKNYTYKLLDTTKIDGRNVFVICFKNKKYSKQSGLEGLLYIDQTNFAVAKALMRARSILDISGLHEFEFNKIENIWFPIGRTFQIKKGKNEDDIKILGGTIQFDADESGSKKRKKQGNDFVYLISKSTHFDLKRNELAPLNRPSIAVEIKNSAVNKSDSFWATNRTEILDEKCQKTYQALDSIVVKKRIESRIRYGRKIINGFFPVSIFDIDLRKLITFNNYEGFRLGIGGITNEKLSRKFRIEGYGAYGIKDEAYKYSFSSAVRIGRFSNSWVGASYTNDVREIASSTFAIDKKAFKFYDSRPINISTFYNYLSWKTFIETKIIPKTESLWELSQTTVEPKFDYTFVANGQSYKKFTMTTAMVSLQLNPFSDYMQTPVGRIEIEKRYPKFTFQYTQTLPEIGQNDFTFSKIDFRTEYEKKYYNGQKTSLLLETGYAFGAIPITHLYNTSPNNLDKDQVIRRVTFGGKNSFETMFFNEFFSSQFAFFQVKHGFSRITLFKKIQPSIVLVSRMVYGDMQKPEQHIGIAFKTLKQGFFESGVEFNQIYNGLGLGVFYRYGPNGLPRFEDNLAVKLSFILNLGL
jgi:hypothetical protein